MRLVNVETKKSIVEFEGERTLFHNKFLEHEMRTLGIPIPHGLRAYFEGKDCIYLDDSHFQQAFKEIYYLTAIDHSRFQWTED